MLSTAQSECFRSLRHLICFLEWTVLVQQTWGGSSPALCTLCGTCPRSLSVSACRGHSPSLVSGLSAAVQPSSVIPIRPVVVRWPRCQESVGTKGVKHLDTLSTLTPFHQIDFRHWLSIPQGFRTRSHCVSVFSEVVVGWQSEVVVGWQSEVVVGWQSEGLGRCCAVSRKLLVCCGTVPVSQRQVSVFATLHPVLSPSLCRSHSPLSLVQGICYMRFTCTSLRLLHCQLVTNEKSPVHATWLSTQCPPILWCKVRNQCAVQSTESVCCTKYGISVLYKVGETCSYTALHAAELSGHLSVSAIAFSFCCDTVRRKWNPLYSRMVRTVSLCHSSGYLSEIFQQSVRYRSFVT